MKIKVWSLNHAEKLQNARAAEKVEILVETKGLYSRPLSNVLRGDRRALIEHSKSTVAAKHHNFSHSRVTVAALNTRRIDPNDPKMAKFSLRPAIGYLDTRR